MKQLLPVLAISLALGLAPAAAAQGHVLVVDSLGGPGAQFTDIAPAVQAAADGDVVLVRPGIYGAFDVSGKALTVVGDITATTSAKVLTGRSSVTSVPAGKEVVIAGLRLTGGLDLVDCDGQVLVQDITFGGTFLGALEASSLPALAVLRCSSVVLARSHLSGYQAPASVPSGDPGPIGLRVEKSSVFAWDSTIRGGRGADGSAATATPPTAGAAGVLVVKGTLRGDQLELVGGTGGSGMEDAGADCSAGASGGTAVVAEGAGSIIELRASGAAGGAGGDAGGAACAPGSSGTDYSVGASQLTLAGGEHRSYSVQPVAREGTSLPLTVEGGLTASGGLALWLLATDGSALPLDLAIGSLVSATPLHVGVLGTTNHLGSLGASVSIGDLGPGIQALRVVSQACVVTLSGEVRIAEPVATTLLDSAF